MDIYQSSTGQLYQKVIDPSGQIGYEPYVVTDQVREELFATQVVPEVSDSELLAAGVIPGSIQAVLTESLSSLFGLAFEDPETISIKIAEISEKLKKIQDKLEKGNIEATTERIEESSAQSRKKMEEAQAKQEAAAKTREGTSIWDKIALAFQVFAAALTMAFGAVLAFICPAVGALTIISGALMLMSVINSLSMDKNGNGLLSQFILACNPNFPREELQKAELAIGIVMSVVGIALGIGAAAALKAVDFATKIPKIIQMATDAILGALNYAGTLQDIVRITATVNSAIQSTTQVVTAIGDGVVAGLEYSAAMVSVEAKRLTAAAQKIQAALSTLEDIIDQALSRLAKGSDTLNAVLDAIMDAQKDTIQTILKMKFST